MPMITKEMSVEELRQQLAPAEHMDRRTFDPRTDQTQFVFEDGKIAFQVRNGTTERYGVTAEAYTRLGQMLGVPGAYIQKTPHHLMVPHMNYWLRNRGLAQITYVADQGTVQLYSKGTMEPVPNEAIIEAVRQVAGNKLNVHHVSHDLFETTFSIVNQEMQYQVDSTVHDLGKRGDIVQCGVTIENSYALIHPLQISAYVHRLVCTNGAISTDNVFRFARRGGGDDGYVDWLTDAINQAFAAADGEVARVRALKEHRFNGHLSDVLQSIFTEYSVPLKVREDVTNMVMDQRVDNLYDLYNTVTYVASNSELALEDGRLATRLMRIGGRIAAHPETCPNCHRVLS